MEALGPYFPFIAMFAVVYFFMIAPQMKRAKQEKKFAAELKRGDKVITKSGMHGNDNKSNRTKVKKKIKDYYDNHVAYMDKYYKQRAICNSCF